MDLDFDQFDLVQVLQAGKYLTGQNATWGDGDWNGGPGGHPGEPPAGDGLFDQRDIVAALQTGQYMHLARLQAGDADMDYDIDQLDFIRVLQAGKYLTGQPATGEGDWDGAPGGYPGNPPAGDGVFNQLDIIAALPACAYLTGPYAATDTRAIAVSPVPEPGSIALLVLGLGLVALAAHHSVRRKELPMVFMRIHLAAIAAMVVTTASARAQVLVPEGVQPGDTYHLVFVTEGTRDAGSTDMADYNAFVQAEAERPGAITENFGIDWFAIGSTATVNARDNAVVEAPVYLLDGLTKVANDLEDIWDDSIDAPIVIDQFGGETGTTWEEMIITGTSLGGTALPLQCPLGGGCIVVTQADQYDYWAFGGGSHWDTEGQFVEGHMYALSEKLTVPLPTTALRAGDADMDLDFDQLDIVQVLQAGKYLTGELATWGEGDWNGAPGGSPGDPPPGNGRFDQLDLIAALNSSCGYLCSRGPYAAIGGDGYSGGHRAGTGEFCVTCVGRGHVRRAPVDATTSSATMACIDSRPSHAIPLAVNLDSTHRGMTTSTPIERP